MKRGHVNQERRGQITNRVDIDHRTLAVDKHQRTGVYEGDTVVGKGF